MTDPQRAAALDRVRAALIGIERRFARAELRAETSLVDDLALDSIRLIDLALALQDGFGIAEFPMQDWYDAESERSGERFTLGSLAALCARLAETQPAAGELDAP